MSKTQEALKRIRSILSAVTGLEDDDEEYLRDAIKSVEQLIEQQALPLGDSNPGLEWDKTPQAFNDWWDSDYDPTGNPYRKDSAAYWAWAGWKAATEQPEYATESNTEELLRLNDLPEPLRLAAMLENTMQWPLHGKAADCLRKMHAALEQPAQQQQVNVPVTDNTYGYAKSLAEAIFKQHFASDEHYASGRIVWGVNDTVIGILTQIDNMVADMVRRPAQQQEPHGWYIDGYGAVLGASEPKSVRPGEWLPFYTSPQPSQPSKPWVGLTEDEKTEIRREHYARTLPLMDAVEAKLREKNNE